MHTPPGHRWCRWPGAPRVAETDDRAHALAGRPRMMHPYVRRKRRRQECDRTFAGLAGPVVAGRQPARPIARVPDGTWMAMALASDVIVMHACTSEAVRQDTKVLTPATCPAALVRVRPRTTSTARRAVQGRAPGHGMWPHMAALTPFAARPLTPPTLPDPPAGRPGVTPRRQCSKARPALCRASTLATYTTACVPYGPPAEPPHASTRCMRSSTVLARSTHMPNTPLRVFARAVVSGLAT